MDAFYASVELLRYPQLRGLPLVVGGRGARGPQLPDSAQRDPQTFERLADYRGRGVVTTASYEARQFGVHSAMGLMRAAQLCPQAILLPADFEEYHRQSRLFKAIIAEFTDAIENRGIDEVYIDFSDAPGGQEQGGRALALRIQQAIRARTGLSCSIGVAPNKLLAKIVSEFNKPSGVTVLYEADLAARIWPLECRRINGIGPKLSARLLALGVRTIGELARCERAWLVDQFGPHQGLWMHAAAWGWDDRAVVTHSEPVSVSRETTFDRDLHAVYDREELRAVFSRLCERVALDLQRDGYAGRTIGIKLRYDNFQRLTREQTIEVPTSDASVIRRIAAQCIRRADLQRRLRLMGVRVAGLVRQGAGGTPSAVAEPSALEQSGELPLFRETPSRQEG
jgi:DNA polymerase-4